MTVSDCQEEITEYQKPVISDLLNSHYLQLERRYPVRTDDSFSKLVVPTGNSDQPFHRWFHLKEGFAWDLSSKIVDTIENKNKEDFTLLDPYVGTGSSIIGLLRSQSMPFQRLHAYGIECNPFLKFVSWTTVKALKRKVNNFLEFANTVIDQLESNQCAEQIIPSLSTFQNPDYFATGVVQRLVQLKRIIQDSVDDSLVRDLGLLCLSSIVEPVSYLRRDGRALRFVSDKEPSDLCTEFLRRAEIISKDLESDRSWKYGTGKIYRGDGRRPQQSLPKGVKADLVLFSPPYPNNIDYTEVYKMEAWILGEIDNRESFYKQRFQTLRSHPSVRFSDYYKALKNGYKTGFSELLEPLINEIPDNKDMFWRTRLVNGYFDDMLLTLLNHKSILSKNGYLVFIVGNSLHGAGDDRFLIAADLIIARLAEMAGYSVEDFIIARQLTRKGNDSSLHRESIVFLKPTPKG